MDDRLPKDTSSERAVIGAVLQDNITLNEIKHLLEPHDFADPTNTHCFKAILDIDLNGGVIDKLTLLNKLKENGVSSMSEDYLVDSIGYCEHPENISDYAKIIKDKSAKRTAIKRIGKALRSLVSEEDDISTILTGLTDSTNKIFLSSTSIKYRRLDKILKDCIKKMDEKTQPDYKDYSIIPTGLIELDRLIKGHRLGCLDVVAARPSMGKTSLALSVLLNVAGRLQIPSLLISLEMTESQITEKILAMKTGVPFSKIEEPKFLDQDDWDTIIEKADVFEKLDLHIDDSSYTPTDIVATIRSGARDGIKFFVLDHLHLVNFGTGNAPRHQVIGKVTKTLASLAKELDVHITVLSQLNREIEKREQHFPTLADLKDSSDIEMDATTVIFIHRDDYYDADAPIGDAVLVVAKNRYGERNRHAPVAFKPDIHLCCNQK